MVVLLVVSGGLYRVISHRLGVVTGSQIKLPIPLSEFPRQIGLWKSQDISIPLAVQKVAGNDDFVSRAYYKSDDNSSVGFYVAYTARPRTMLGHRPQICYPAVGWIHDGTEKISASSLSGRLFPCLLHRFHRPAPSYESIVVLNFYIVNGELTDDERTFTGIGWRAPNIEGNAARYVAQVQLSSPRESAVKLAVSELGDRIMQYLPDRNGAVQAAGNTPTTESPSP